MNMSTDKVYNITELKKNYRKISLKWHPDKNPDNKASEIFFFSDSYPQ
jgi:DnaJ-class molecular chaperone